MAPNPTFNSKASLMMRVEKVEANVYKTTRRNINGCSLLGDKGRIRKTRLEQGNTDGRGKQGRNRETQQDSENGNQRQQESQKLIR